MQMRWVSGLLPGNRTPRLWFARGGHVCRFAGESIPGWVVVLSADFAKAGRWSSAKYQLQLAPGVRPIPLVAMLHQEYGYQYHSWVELAADLQLPLEVAQFMIRQEFPRTADRLDGVESLLDEMEEQYAEHEEVIIVFGNPSRREYDAGFWDAPKSGKTSDGRNVTISPATTGRLVLNWQEPPVVEPAEAKVLGVRHTPGRKGGCVEVRVAVPVLMSR